MAEENTENRDWMDELIDDISEKILGVAKFKTHKQRKAFLGDLSNQIKTNVSNNTIPKEKPSIRKTESAITRPNPDGKNKGFAVMTESDSSRGDDVLGVGPGASTPGKATNLSENKKGMRIW